MPVLGLGGMRNHNSRYHSNEDTSAGDVGNSELIGWLVDCLLVMLGGWVVGWLVGCLID